MELTMNKPSLGGGLRRTLKLWPMIGALWLAPILFLAPLRIMLAQTAGRALARIPEAFTPPPGDLGILVMHSLFDAIPLLILAAVSGMILVWFWNILWQAGICHHLIWDSESGVSVPKILGSGAIAWARYFRLSLVSFLAFILVVGGSIAGFFALIHSAFDSMQEDLMVMWRGAAMLCIGLLKIVLWAIALRGAWELALPRSHSALFAWFRGLRGLVRQIFSTLCPVFFLGFLSLASVLLPLYFFVLYGRGSWLGPLFIVCGALLSAFFQLWLFLTMAPITGLVEKKPRKPGRSSPETVKLPEEADDGEAQLPES
jgi:hypothetical protein